VLNFIFSRFRRWEMTQEQVLTRKLTRAKRREKPPEPPDWNTIGNILWSVLIMVAIIRELLRIFRFLPSEDSPIDTAITVLFLAVPVITFFNLSSWLATYKSYTGWKKVIESKLWTFSWLIAYLALCAGKKFFVG
jgi:hypothetical protein